jgi:hypothetical protein
LPAGAGGGGMTDDVRIAMLPHSRNVFFRVVNGEEILPSSADYLPVRADFRRPSK